MDFPELILLFDNVSLYSLLTKHDTTLVNSISLKDHKLLVLHYQTDLQRDEFKKFKPPRKLARGNIAVTSKYEIFVCFASFTTPHEYQQCMLQISQIRKIADVVFTNSFLMVRYFLQFRWFNSRVKHIALECPIFEKKPTYETTTLLEHTNQIMSKGQWSPFFQKENTQKQIATISEHIQKEKEPVYPPLANIYNALISTPFVSVKVIIVGMDPYHKHGQAMGLSFSVPDGVPIPSSLQNIFKELEQEEFPISRRSGNLTLWTYQGVLLLNTALTVRKATPGSHTKIWEEFSTQLIVHISQNHPGCVWLLWGNHAKKLGCLIDKQKHSVLTASHPSGLSANKGFLGSGCFKECNKILEERYETSGIGWSL